MTSTNESIRPPRLLRTIIEAADELRVGRSTIYELIRTKQLETVKIGRCTRVPAASITAFVAHLRSPAE
jgi:excisionase family DNA binding protein